jgi:hypothetical protein
MIEPVGHEAYSLFETEARERLRGRGRGGTGVAAWTSDRVEIFMKEQSKPGDPTLRSDSLRLFGVHDQNQTLRYLLPYADGAEVLHSTAR